MIPYNAAPPGNFNDYRTYYSNNRVGAGANNVDNPDFNPYLGGYVGTDGVWRPYVSSIGTQNVLGGSNVNYEGPAMQSINGSDFVPIQTDGKQAPFTTSSGGPTSMQSYDAQGNPINDPGLGSSMFVGNKKYQGSWNVPGALGYNPSSPIKGFSQTLNQNQAGPSPYTPTPVTSTPFQYPKISPQFNDIQPLNIYGGSPAWMAMQGMR